MTLASFDNNNFMAGQHRGGTVGEEARTGKRFPLQLPIKIHKEDRRDDKRHDREI